MHTLVQGEVLMSNTIKKLLRKIEVHLDSEVILEEMINITEDHPARVDVNMNMLIN